jgi:hypothetical protein
MIDTGVVKFLADTFSPRSTAPVFLTSLVNSGGDPRVTPRKVLTRESAELEAFASKWDQPERALYFCVATLKERSRERSKKALAELVQLHVDLDFKDIVEDPAAIEAAVAGATLPPNRIVRSGHGLHAYWWFDRPLEGSAENIARVEALLQRLVEIFAGDCSVAECSRLMRVPGSHNSKNGEWTEVTIAEAQHDEPHGIEQLEKWLADLAPVLTHKSRPQSQASDPFAAYAAWATTAIPIDVEGRLAMMTHRGPGETAVHPTQVSCTASLLSRGMALEEVVADILAATQAMAERDGVRGWDWQREEADIRGMSESWLRKHPDIGIVELDEEESDRTDPAGKPTLDEENVAVSDVQNDAAVSSDAISSAATNAPGPMQLNDFYAYMTTHTYIYVPTGDLWPKSSVNAVLRPVPVISRDGRPVLDANGKPKHMTPSNWLDRRRRVVQLTWAPGHPQIIKDRVVAEGGWKSRPGAWLFNLYHPPTLAAGDADKAGPWIDHVNKVYPTDAAHITQWLAHRVQRPHEKLNHALFLGGAQGIGKDTLLEPVQQAIGPWNMHEISPMALASSFNGFAKSVILRISEAHDLGDTTRFQLYERLKVYAAAPPDALRVNTKYVAEFHIFNICAVVITSNYKTDSLYLPADDRRHYIAWSDLHKEDFTSEYWSDLWSWYRREGYGHVAAYLAAYDLSGFNAKDAPPKTDAFWDIASANLPPEYPELLSAIEHMKNPDAFTLEDLRQHAIGELEEWLNDRRNRRTIPHRLESCGYVPTRNLGAKRDGYWKIGGAWQAIYAKSTLTPTMRLKVAQKRQKRK